MFGPTKKIDVYFDKVARKIASMQNHNVSDVKDGIREMAIHRIVQDRSVSLAQALMEVIQREEQANINIARRERKRAAGDENTRADKAAGWRTVGKTSAVRHGVDLDSSNTEKRTAKILSGGMNNILRRDYKNQAPRKCFGLVADIGALKREVLFSPRSVQLETRALPRIGYTPIS
tara:strand:+ start:539 stop:1066 length:528 start_codon:yes stop_codon:yes gene_type:complete